MEKISITFVVSVAYITQLPFPYPFFCRQSKVLSSIRWFYGTSVVLFDATFDKQAMRCHDFERIRRAAREASEATTTRHQLFVHSPKIR